MKITTFILFAFGSASSFAHTLETSDREALRAHILEEWSVKQAFQPARTAHDEAMSGDARAGWKACITLRPQIASTAPASVPNAPEAAKPFLPFTKLDLRADGDFLYIGSNGLPDHDMMVGITAWQQQVPIPQKYFGDNAWRIPLKPVVAKNPMSAKSNFFKGAIALAANGVPIFNPIKTNGHTDTFLAGELDQWGGHCGRADDYHYHIAPVHLQAQVGKGLPVAYALDGYAIYGYTEPDGSPVMGLDEFNGHESASGYHYHATKTYPYLNGGFHGEVVEQNGQVDPQPRTSGVREYLPPLPGAKIIGFTREDGKKFSVKYEVANETRYVNYTLNDDSTVKFEFVDAQGQVTTETHSPRERGGGGGGGGERPPGGGGKGERGKGKGDRGKGGQRPEMKREEERRPSEKPGTNAAASTPPMLITPKHSGNMTLTSPALKDGDALPDEFNGNGEGATLPLEWKGAPEGTQSYALVMDHIDRDGILKTYWTLYDIPASVTSLPKNVKGIGKLGGTWKRDASYVPPHSAGGAKQTYTLHLYALPAAPQFDGAEIVTREQLLTKIKDSILDSAEFHVTYQRPRDDERGGGSGDRKEKKPRTNPAKP